MKVAIVGGGIVGLCAAWSLTKAGHAATVFEQGEIPNALAASGDHHRIIRRGYAGQDGYARTIDDAFAAWEALWEDLGARHYEERGVLCVSQFPGDEGDQFSDGYARMGVAFERLRADAAAERWPFFDAATIDYVSLVPDGGALLCRRIASDLVTWLRAHGAELVENSMVSRVDPIAGAVETSAGERAFDAVIVAAGAWATRLFRDLDQTLTTYRTAVVYLTPPANVADAWATAPVFLSVGGTTVDGYIIPPVAGLGLKFGAGIHKTPAAADERRAVEPGEGARLRDHFSPPIKDVGAYEVGEVRTCAYTFTADERFYAERRGKAWIVSACSGHGYKFGAAVGQRVAAAVTSGDVDGLTRWIEARV